MSVVIENPVTVCFHCGEDTNAEEIVIDQKHFCCTGCKTVYEIINKNALCEYYDFNETPGINQKTKVREGKFDFLDDAQITKKLVHFKDDTNYHITFYLPQMHCSSCIWILEHLHKVTPGIQTSQVNFIKKEVTIIYNFSKTSLKKVALKCDHNGMPMSFVSEQIIAATISGSLIYFFIRCGWFSHTDIF